jgi:hypothetical protein
MEAHHPKKVSKAIQAALNDISLLRALVLAPNAETAKLILADYDEDLRLSGPDLEVFWTSLTKGVMTITAKGLVHYYNHLEGHPTAMREKPGEWTP